MYHHVTWSPGISLAQMEKMVIVKCLDFYRQNKKAAAVALGIPLDELYEKVEQYAMEEVVAADAQIKVDTMRAEFQNRARGNPPNNIGLPYSGYDAARESVTVVGPPTKAIEMKKPSFSKVKK